MASSRNSQTRDKARGTLSLVGNVITRRDSAILFVFILLAIWLFMRLFTLTVVDAEELAQQGSNVRTTSIELSARRGTVYDRNGKVLAMDVEATTIYANPSKISNPKETAEILHEVLGGSTQDYYDLITENPESTFVYIEKKADPEFEQALLDVNQEFINEEVARYRAEGNDVPAEIITPLTGIEFLPDTRREYPYGNIGAQVIGAVNDEGIGVSGLEQTYDSILRGIDGERVLEQSKQVSQNSNPLPMIDSVIEEVDPVAGQDIIISIDIETQQFLELNLQAVAAQRETKDASAILLDGSTGEIVATASIPLYDRKNITQEDAENGATNAKAITQPYEPGSTFKSVIAAAALEEGMMTVDETIYCPSYLEIYDKVIRDSVDRPSMDMSLRQIIANSSNIGVSLIEQSLGHETFDKYLTRLGLGDFTHVDYPGETPGNLAPVEEWTDVQAANIAFGQGLEVSLLQMASIYGALANDGVMEQPHFLISRPQYDVEPTYNSTKVFDAQATRDLEEALRSCVTEGYGMNANVEGYDAVGKTGTAEQSNREGGYGTSWGEFICSFAGYIDNSNSNYVFMSSFTNPTNYADSPATTFFSSVMSFVANRYMIEPQEESPVVEMVDVDTTNLTDDAPLIESQSQAAAEAAARKEPVVALPTPRAGVDWQVDTSG